MDKIINQIVQIAKNDERIRFVSLGGSRANPQAKIDSYQDYDIVFGVYDVCNFTNNHQWVDIFGPQVMMQLPEEMAASPSKLPKDKFTYLMLFQSGHRIDLSLINLDCLDEYLKSEPYNQKLLDKDDVYDWTFLFNDEQLKVKKPSPEAFENCCNEFWWVATYVAKGIQRQQFLYAVDHLNNHVRPELIRMLTWFVGFDNDFKVNLGKTNYQLQNYLDEDLWKSVTKTFDLTSLERVESSLKMTISLFSNVSKEVAKKLEYIFPVYADRMYEVILNQLKH